LVRLLNHLRDVDTIIFLYLGYGFPDGRLKPFWQVCQLLRVEGVQHPFPRVGNDRQSTLLWDGLLGVLRLLVFILATRDLVKVVVVVEQRTTAQDVPAVIETHVDVVGVLNMVAGRALLEPAVE
jgi:hypothetical protein